MLDNVFKNMKTDEKNTSLSRRSSSELLLLIPVAVEKICHSYFDTYCIVAAIHEATPKEIWKNMFGKGISF